MAIWLLPTTAYIMPLFFKFQTFTVYFDKILCAEAFKMPNWNL